MLLYACTWEVLSRRLVFVLDVMTRARTLDSLRARTVRPRCTGCKLKSSVMHILIQHWQQCRSYGCASAKACFLTLQAEHALRGLNGIIITDLRGMG